MRRGHGHSERGRQQIRHRHSLHGHSQHCRNTFRRLKTTVLTFVVLVVATNSLDLIHGHDLGVEVEENYKENEEQQQQQQQQNNLSDMIQNRLTQDNNNDNYNNVENSISRDKKFDIILNSNSRNHHDGDKSAAVTSSSDFWLSRTKADIYNDAYLSFVFACRHSIYVGRPPLAEDAKSAFRKWILLLQMTLPPTWKLSTLIDDIEENLDLVLEDEDELDKVVSRHPPDVTTWSDSCSRGDSSQGYTCGLWQLFHIMTIGYVQWMMNNVGDKKMYSTDYVGENLSEYIEHFFGCEVCRQNFMVEYETCAFGRCDRLSTKKSKDVQDWNELPLWLHELHNSVNVRLMKEKAEREGRTVSDTELKAVRWPARHDCPSCWNDDGSWNPETILQFMLLFYWPEELIPKDLMPGLLPVSGISGKDYLDLGGTIEGEAKVASWMYSLVGFFVFSFILSAASWVKKRREVVRTGYHKKKDDSPIADQV